MRTERRTVHKLRGMSIREEESIKWYRSAHFQLFREACFQNRIEQRGMFPRTVSSLHFTAELAPTFTDQIVSTVANVISEFQDIFTVLHKLPNSHDPSFRKRFRLDSYVPVFIQIWQWRAGEIWTIDVSAHFGSCSVGERLTVWYPDVSCTSAIWASIDIVQFLIDRSRI